MGLRFRLAEPSDASPRIRGASLGLAFVTPEVEFGDCLLRKGDIDAANVPAGESVGVYAVADVLRETCASHRSAAQGFEPTHRFWRICGLATEGRLSETALVQPKATNG